MAWWLLFALVMPAHAGGKKDSDGDGVIDKEDLCFKAPEDMDGFEDEDGCPELDNDRDGRLDDMDQCPDEAEDEDGFQDGDGCPDPDDDGDGVLDADDACKSEPGPAKGCPAPELDVFGVLDQTMVEGSVEKAQATWTTEGWEANLTGPSGLSGKEAYEQGIAKGWSMVPDGNTLDRSGDSRVVKVGVVAREGGEEQDAVWCALVQVESDWRIKGCGEGAEEVRALLE